MISLNSLPENFRGEHKEGGLVLFFIERGEPEALLGESGGTLAAGFMEGNGLLPTALEVKEFPGVLLHVPAFASSIKDFTCSYSKIEGTFG